MEEGGVSAQLCVLCELQSVRAASSVIGTLALRLHVHNPNVTLMRTTAEECATLGEILAGKLNQATGPATVLLPAGGVSALDRPGQPFHDPAADRALFDALRRHLAPHVTVREIDAHINDAAFADAVAEALLAMLGT